MSGRRIGGRGRKEPPPRERAGKRGKERNFPAGQRRRRGAERGSTPQPCAAPRPAGAARPPAATWYRPAAAGQEVRGGGEKFISLFFYFCNSLFLIIF